MRGEVYWVDHKGAIGAEIRKTRPSVVVSSDDHNERMATVTVVPFSSAAGRARLFEVAVPPGAFGDGRPCRIKTHQVRVVDKSRLGGRMGSLSPVLMAALEASLRGHLGL